MPKNNITTKKTAAILTSMVICLFAYPSFAEESCTLPDEIEKPSILAVDCLNNIKPDFYTLSLSWSPEHCLSASQKDRFQCQLNNFQFVVHGLWGQYYKAKNKCEQPRHCSASLVDETTIRQTLCTMPSVTLIQGEWQKHGTCTGMPADQYFEKTRELWSSLQKPDITKIINSENQISPNEIVDAFISANKDTGLFSDAIAVQVGRKAQLLGVLICYDLQFQYQACTTVKTPDTQTIQVTLPKKND